jgi:hypothetical protein
VIAAIAVSGLARLLATGALAEMQGASRPRREWRRLAGPIILSLIIAALVALCAS